MTDAERRAVMLLLLIVGAGSVLSVVADRFPSVLPDLVRHGAIARAPVEITARQVVTAEAFSRVAPSPIPSAGGLVREFALSNAAGLSAVVQREAGASSERERRSARPAAPVDVNACDAAALATLPGIGPTRAAAILAERTAHGPFRSVEDLLRIRGIGPRTLDRMRSYLVLSHGVGGPSAGKGPRPPARLASGG